MILINHIYIKFICKSSLRIKKFRIEHLKSYTFTYKIMYLSSIGFEVKSSKFNKIYNSFFRTLSLICREKNHSLLTFSNTLSNRFFIHFLLYLNILTFIF